MMLDTLCTKELGQMLRILQPAPLVLNATSLNLLAYILRFSTKMEQFLCK